MTLKDTFSKDGFAIIPNVLTPGEVSDFRKVMKTIFDSDVAKSQGDLQRVRSNIFVRFPEVQDFFLKPEIIEPLKRILGNDFFIMPEISAMESQYGNWHKDTTSIELFGFDFHKSENFKVVNAAIYLQDNSSYGGGLDVVPGSHKMKDSFVDNYRDYKPKEKKEPSGFKSKIKKFLNLISPEIMKKLQSLKHGSDHLKNVPVRSSDQREGRFMIPSKAGDLVVFDLRLDHKASWPETLEGLDQGTRKYALYVICGANNEDSLKYRNYLNDRAKNQSAYNYLNSYEVDLNLSYRVNKLGISAL